MTIMHPLRFHWYLVLCLLGSLGVLPVASAQTVSSYPVHYLDSVALARHIGKIRVLHTEGERFPISFLDSSEVPPGTKPGSNPQPLRVLFIGNSLTYYHEMPRLFSALAAHGLHRRVVVGETTIPGAALDEIWNGTDVRQVIEQLPWDYVVLQLKPSGTAGGLQDLFEEAVTPFQQVITAHHARTVLWDQYWGHDELSASRRMRVDSAVINVAGTVGAVVAPIAEGWEAVYAADSMFYHGLRIPGDIHPSDCGSYLIAAILYRVITGQSPLGLPTKAASVTVTASQAAVLQKIAATVQP